MKYYISNIKVFDIEKIKILSSCIKKEDNYSMIFSLDGVFKINKKTNQFQKMLYKDKEINYIKNDNFDILEDPSEINYIDVSQVPFEHFSKKIKEETYMTRENAKIKLVILRTGDEIVDFYFESNESISDPFIMEDLELFLSSKK